MLTVEEALERVLARVPTNATERVPLQSARGRVLAEVVTAGVDLPPWAGSAMDGFAVRAADVPGDLRVVETIAAGRVPTVAVGAGTASRIMTGAPVPAGADAVVMVEDTESIERGGEARVRVRCGATPGQHIRPAGSEIAAGSELLVPGVVLGFGALGVLAALGHPTVAVWVRPRVGLLSTGDEVVEPGFPLGAGQIWSSNLHALAALCEDAGADPVYLGNVSDDPVATAAAFRRALRCDLVVSTGGVSVGDFDHVKQVMAGLGGDGGGGVEFWRVAMKPGKPLAYGFIGGRPVFGLPGNPVSCMVNFLQFVRPVVRTMLGDPRPFLPVIQARLDQPWRRKPGRAELVRVRLAVRPAGAVVASVVGVQGSAHLAGMAMAHGLMLVGAETSEVNGEVSVQVFDPTFGASPDPGYRWT
ncbi:MAG: molybdopterin molybdenumtransferase MoeA [Myxococcales bacterium]|nr:molybdopterin molybdenumtransferase MoeA [Myxococcales bacterium]